MFDKGIVTALKTANFDIFRTATLTLMGVARNVIF